MIIRNRKRACTCSAVLIYLDLFSVLFAKTLDEILKFCCGSGCQIKAQAAARVGRSGISDGCFTAPEESADEPPSCLAKEILC